MNEKKFFAESELIINEDGSIFHLHLKPEQLADRVILVGDPGRVALVASHFETKECEVQSREFHTITGTFQGKRITVLSTGIGCDNIDIVVNELDALANIDFKTRTEKDAHRTLTLVRIGTCGGLQPETPSGTYVASVKSIGFDGLLNFYAGRNEVCDLGLEEAFKKHMHWNPLLCAPYVIDADKELIDRIAQNDMVRGITIASGGFFGPQGRELRVPLADPDQNKKVESFEYQGLHITNFEMESSALAGLSAFLLENDAHKQAVNDIVHPAVATDFMLSNLQWLESAILFESGFNHRVKFNHVVCVSAPLEMRVRRIMERDSITRESALQWIGRQMPQEEIEKRVDFVIVNDGYASLETQIDKMFVDFNWEI